MPDSTAPSDLALRRLVHELNTPVGVCAMATSMLPAQIDAILAELDAASLHKAMAQLEEWRETVALLQSSLQLSVQILNRSTSPAASVCTLPLIDLAATLQAAVKLQATRRPQLRLTCQVHFAQDLLVRADSAVWQQVIGNLVANSMLHGFDGRGQGVIHLVGTLLPGNHVLVHYYDDGMGLSEEAYARLFDDGYSTRSEQGGSGLGMGIVRNLVRHKLGGHIDIHRAAKGVHISIEAPC